MDNNLDKLKDIKDIVPINDNSMVILIAIIFSTIALIIIVTYLLKKDKIPPRPTKKQLLYKKIKNLDLNRDNIKDIVYTITIDGALFLDEKNQDLYDNIQKKVEKFKYKKDIESLDKETKDLIKQFISSIKVGKNVSK